MENEEKIMTRFNELDPILHSQLRLAVISLLMSAEVAEFTYIREQTGSTAGNLSIQITKLKEAGYIKVEKKFRNNYPLTLCSITSTGKQKFGEYVEAIKDYIKPVNKK
jgi:predicted transcriptional regulator